MRSITSATYISNKAPATLIIEPEKDSLIPSQSVYAFADQARTAGVDMTLARIPFADHAFDDPAAGSLGNQARLTIIQNWAENIGSPD